MNLAMGPNGDSLFEALPKLEVLLETQAIYRRTLGDLLAHAIKVSTGELPPSQLFVANPVPPTLTLKRRPFIIGNVEIPDWSSQQDVDMGAGTGGIMTSADALGLIVVLRSEVPANEDNVWTITEISPKAGTVVPVGSKVFVKVIQP